LLHSNTFLCILTPPSPLWERMFSRDKIIITRLATSNPIFADNLQGCCGQ
jgi:hypothetical protein